MEIKRTVGIGTYPIVKIFEAINFVIIKRLEKVSAIKVLTLMNSLSGPIVTKVFTRGIEKFP